MPSLTRKKYTLLIVILCLLDSSPIYGMMRRALTGAKPRIPLTAFSRMSLGCSTQHTIFTRRVAQSRTFSSKKPKKPAWFNPFLPDAIADTQQEVKYPLLISSQHNNTEQLKNNILFMFDAGILTQDYLHKIYTKENYDQIINFLSNIPTYFQGDKKFTESCYTAAVDRITQYRGARDAIHPVLLGGLIAYSPRSKKLCEAIAQNIQYMNGQELYICLEIAHQKYHDLAKLNCTEYKDHAEFMLTHKICSIIIETALKTIGQDL